MKLAVPVMVLLLAVSASSAFGQTSSREDFEEWCGVMQGRWIGEVTWAVDAPGFGKKDEKVTSYSEIKLTADGNALNGVFYGGKGKSTWLTSYDAAAKQIKGFTVTSGGTVWNFVVFRKDGEWKGKYNGSNPDGKTMVSEDTLTITDGGNTHTWTGTVTVEGEEPAPYRDAYRRVSK